MSLFESDDFEVCPVCHGLGTVYDAKIDVDRPCRCQLPSTGKYSGADPTATEESSGAIVESS
jgi:hypothetical protein